MRGCSSPSAKRLTARPEAAAGASFAPQPIGLNTSTVGIVCSVGSSRLGSTPATSANWAGFYRAIDGELVLGPFCGKPACIRIPFGQGVCGTAAASGESQLVADVNAFSGHIACDAASRSELVVPVTRGGKVIAVIDLDAPREGRFDADDQAGIEALARIVAKRI